MSQSVDITADLSGRKGAVIAADTVPVVGPFSAVTVLSDCVFSAFDESGTTGSMVGLTLPAGLTFHGNITGFTLSSGAVRAYRP